jgi:hypothetical protein
MMIIWELRAVNFDKLAAVGNPAAFAHGSSLVRHCAYEGCFTAALSILSLAEQLAKELSNTHPGEANQVRDTRATEPTVSTGSRTTGSLGSSGAEELRAPECLDGVVTRLPYSFPRAVRITQRRKKAEANR